MGRRDLDGSIEEARRIQANLNQTNAEKAALEADHNKTKLHLDAVEKHLHGVQASAHNLQIEMRRANVSVSQLSVVQASLEDKVANLVPKVDKFTENLRILSAAHQ